MRVSIEAMVAHAIRCVGWMRGIGSGFQNGVAGRIIRLRRPSCVTNHRATRLRPEMQGTEARYDLHEFIHFFMCLYGNNLSPLFYSPGRHVTVNGLSPALESCRP